MPDKNNARVIAHKAICEVVLQKRSLSEALFPVNQLDISFAKSLAFGSIRFYHHLNDIITPRLDKPLEKKNLDNEESELAKEILFGLEDDADTNNLELSTMENILKQSNAFAIDKSIRNEIDEQFASEKNSLSKSWNDEIEILDSIAESERLRNQLLNNEVQSNEVIPKVKVKNKIKKKKKFFFF